ncbi:MAG: hypothetical protein AB202_03575 [Parcubacteria bacterium C7867-007]|nr:MAG: hypothetical protein AB202_03575 [Parcubacteria bacterium C7867-007]
MKKNAGMAWTVAGVLAVVVIILLAMMATSWQDKQPKNLDDVLRNGKEDISELRERIRMDCAKTDEAGKKMCEKDKQELTELLKEFSTDVTYSTTTTAN